MPGLRVTEYFLKIWIVLIILGFVVEMCLIPQAFLRKLRQDDDRSNSQEVSYNITKTPKNGESVGVYYSNWSPYEPRNFSPTDLPLNSLTHVYYAFFVIDTKTGAITSSDSWSDFQIPLKSGEKGCISQLHRLKMSAENNFKTIMSIGGWSNRHAFHKIASSDKKIKRFIDTSVETMFHYGFDGIELDWEFPEDDKREPFVYLELVKGIRGKLNELELAIFGQLNSSSEHFQLSIATPAFEEKLSILLIDQMDNYIDLWNMMTYDFHGEWSDMTGYHSNLYTNASAHKRHWLGSSEEKTLCANYAISFMMDRFKISADKISLGMAAYGRGFTDVDISNTNSYLNRPFRGVGGASEGEPGIWLYNQLPIPSTIEYFDPDLIAAYCFEPNSRTFVGYDNVESMQKKAKYITNLGLNGGFWWEACGDSKTAERSLVMAFVKEIKISSDYVSMFKDEKVQEYYKYKYGEAFFAGF